MREVCWEEIGVPVAVVTVYRKCITRAYVNGSQRVALLVGCFVCAGVNICLCNSGEGHGMGTMVSGSRSMSMPAP